MDPLLLTIGIGLAAGSVHVVAGPDHLAAVAPYAANNPRRATRVGLWWGFGHGVGAGISGLLGIVARDLVNLEALSAWTEFLVGFMLIGIGLWALRSAVRTTVHSHSHHHDGDDHQHLHVHSGGTEHEPGPTDVTDQAHGHSHAPLAVGMLHGAAGTGHLLAVLPSLALPPVSAACYLGSYFVAAVLSMGAFGWLMGLVGRSGKQGQLRGLMFISSFAAIIIGMVWVGTTVPGA